MSGVLHPTGPEPAQTYWVRRGVLLAVVLLLAVIVVVGVANLTRAAVATSPPPPIPAVVASPAPSTGPSQSPAMTTPQAGATPSVGTPGSGATPAPPSVSPTAASSASPASSATPAAKPSASLPAKATPTTTVIGTPDCRPADLRVSVKGDRSLSPGENSTFRLTLTNRGAQTCLVSVTDRNFELEITSGKDRIWSSQDCGTALAAFDKKLASQAGVGWKMTWNGERSVKGKQCKRGAETPLPGTYWATAQLDGAKRVQLRLIIS